MIAGVWFAYKTHKNGGGLSGMLATAVGHDENTKKNLKEIKVLLLGVSTDLDSQLTDTIIVQIHKKQIYYQYQEIHLQEKIKAKLQHLKN